MITTTDKLHAKVAAMPRDVLEDFARRVILSLYGTSYSSEDDGIDEEADAEIAALKLQDGDVYLDSDNEWNGDTFQALADDVAFAGLEPENL